MGVKRLSIQQRKEIFLALVTAQDTGLMTVGQSLQHIRQQYDLTDTQLRQIEEEGIDKDWPPLDEAIQQAS